MTNTQDVPFDAHTPATIIQLFANAFHIAPENNLLWLKGIYQDRKKGSYQGYYYDRLQDVQDNQIITIRVPERIKHTLTAGQQYVFKGSLYTTSRPDGVLEPVFLVAELVMMVALPPDILNADSLLARKREQGVKDVDAVLLEKLRRGQAPRLALIYGVTSIVRQDVMSALGEAHRYYFIDEKRLDILREDQIHATLYVLDQSGYDAIGLVRGGGRGQELFDHPTMARVAVELHTPLITAMGHAQEVSLLERLADKYLTTPTALGTYLAQLVANVSAPVSSETAAGGPDRSSVERQLAWMRFLLLAMAALIVILLLTR